ncbi:MAG: type II toxin-antitoxin system RelE/ParE family toxin [Halothiobacillaceae bacterium]
MTWDVRQTRRFARAYKKLHNNLIADVNEAITQVADNPDKGELNQQSRSWFAKIAAHHAVQPSTSATASSINGCTSVSSMSA